MSAADPDPGLSLTLMSDTHLPTRAKDLPAALWAAVDAADVVVHAGDWMAESLLDALAQRATRLVACWGNNDGPALRERLPETARVHLGGVRLAVTHETGDARGRETRCEGWFGPSSPDPADVLVFGHSHIPWDSTTPGGLRLLNPGSPTDRRRQPACSFMTARISAGTVRDVVRHDLPRATR